MSAAYNDASGILRRRRRPTIEVEACRWCGKHEAVNDGLCHQCINNANVAAAQQIADEIAAAFQGKEKAKP